MTRSTKYPPGIRERTVRMAFEHESDHPSQWATIRSVSSKFGMSAETLRSWIRQAERDLGRRPGLTTDEREQMKQLQREVRELRRANEIPFCCGNSSDRSVWRRFGQTSVGPISVPQPLSTRWPLSTRPPIPRDRRAVRIHCVRGGGGNRTPVPRRPFGASPGAAGGLVSPRGSHRRRSFRPARVRCPAAAPGRDRLREPAHDARPPIAGGSGRTAT